MRISRANCSDRCECELCRFERSPKFQALAVRWELDAAPYEFPTANNPDELPDQEGSRYPLMTVSRESAPMLILLAYLFRLMWWRCSTWSRRRRGIE